MLKYITDKDHYTEVLSRCEKVKHDLWIGTADHLDSVWQGTHCAKCKRKDFCGDRIG